MRLQLEQRNRVLVNTDPQRRCYNGCHFSSKWQWTAWEWIEWNVNSSKMAERLTFWRSLNDYSVSEGGAAREYRIVEVADECPRD